MPLTREALQAKTNPPQENRCAVKLLRDTLTPDEQQVLNDAIALPSRVLSAQGIRDLLADGDVDEALIPSIGVIQDHRRGAGACKCPR